MLQHTILPLLAIALLGLAPAGAFGDQEPACRGEQRECVKTCGRRSDRDRCTRGCQYQRNLCECEGELDRCLGRGPASPERRQRCAAAKQRCVDEAGA